jgi:hypothetical protein
MFATLFYNGPFFSRTLVSPLDFYGRRIYTESNFIGRSIKNDRLIYQK